MPPLPLTSIFPVFAVYFHFFLDFFPEGVNRSSDSQVALSMASCAALYSEIMPAYFFFRAAVSRIQQWPGPFRSYEKQPQNMNSENPFQRRRIDRQECDSCGLRQMDRFPRYAPSTALVSSLQTTFFHFSRSQLRTWSAKSSRAIFWA